MRILNVRLENIKSYKDTRIDLGPGATAIRGSNGAGKSTLVEAIGFALFDALAYKQAQFVREGERIGIVTVCFLSALDDREYQVVRRCGGTSDWYVYDPEVQDRVVEQRADVVAFLRQHLRIESDLDLATLFNDAIGVPQGTFTSDFLLTPATRKKKFDQLLKVEDYRTAADKLLDANRSLKEQQSQQDNRIAALERETAQLDGWRAQFAEGREQERLLTTQLANLQRETAALEAQRTALNERKERAAALQSAAALAQAEFSAAEAQRQLAERQLAEADEAVRICAGSRADHDAYQAAEKRLTQARAQEQQRTRIREQRFEAARRHEGARSDLTHAQEQLAAAHEAARALVDLDPQARRQQTLEAERAQAGQRVARREEVTVAHQRVQDALRAVSQAYAQDEQEMTRLEQLRPEADALDERRGQLEAAQAAQATYATNSARLKTVRLKLREKIGERDKKAQDEAAAATTLAGILARQAEAEGCAGLEVEQKRLDDQIRQINLRIEQHRASRQQSGVGNCPFLREPCLNIQKRGENSLISYFDRLITQDEDALTPVRRREGELATQIEQARAALAEWNRRGEFADKRRTAADDGARLERECVELDEERRQLEATLAASNDEQTVERLRAAWNRSNAAALQCARLPDLQRHAHEAMTRRDALTADLTKHTSELASLESAAANLQRIEAHLAQLDDPQAKVAALRPVAAEKSTRAAGVSALQQTLDRLVAELAAFDKQLAPFATLDDELARLEETRARANAAHLNFLRHERLAGQLGERKKAHAAARQQEHTASAKHTRAASEFAKAQAAFDGDHLTQVSATLDEKRSEHAKNTETLRLKQEEGARLARDIARVEALLADLAAARDERQTLDDLERMLRQFRDTIKEAGPNILRAQLHSISREANRIFGEILGDRSAELSWEADYEVALRRDGRERAFAQLSGGEQMSAALAVRLALLRRLSRLDIAFFDEPTQNMDGERRGNLAEQIRRVRGFDQLLVISHDDTFEQGLDGVIYLEKRNGQTTIAEADALLPA